MVVRVGTYRDGVPCPAMGGYVVVRPVMWWYAMQCVGVWWCVMQWGAWVGVLPYVMVCVGVGAYGCLALLCPYLQFAFCFASANPFRAGRRSDLCRMLRK